MSAITHDMPAVATRTYAGLVLALVSAASFGLSGSLASGLLATGWTPGAVVLVRLGVGAVALTPLGAWSLRGRWGAVRRRLGLIGGYGLLAVAGAQFCYFAAVQRMEVGPAILIEYTAPAAVVMWLWLVHGHRPNRVTLAGAALAVVGLVLVLDVLGGVDVSASGVAWALGAMLGATTYFLINADHSTGLPPIALAWLGLVVGFAILGVLGATGLMPMDFHASRVDLAGSEVAWWLPVALLGVVTAAVAYGTGIAAGRRLGSRLASFLALFEVVASVLFAWALLDQLPHLVQLLGGVLVLAGVVVVRLGEESLDQGAAALPPV